MITMLVRNIPSLILGIVFLAGCSSGHELMPTPNIYLHESGCPGNHVPPLLQDNQVDLLYFSDRAPERNDLNKLSYGVNRSASMAFGSAVVEIGENLSWAELVKASASEQRDSSLDLNVISITEQNRFPQTPYPFSIVDGMWINNAEVRNLDSGETKPTPFPNFLWLKSAHKSTVDRFLGN